MTKTISIHYDLRTPGRDYETLYTAIKNVGASWAHPLESVWLVVTTNTVTQIRDYLARYIDQNDQLLIADIGPDWASRNLAKTMTDWLNANLG